MVIEGKEVITHYSPSYTISFSWPTLQVIWRALKHVKKVWELAPGKADQWMIDNEVHMVEMGRYIDIHISILWYIKAVIQYQYKFSHIDISNIMIYQCIDINILYLMTDTVWYNCQLYGCTTTYLVLLKRYSFGKGSVHL